MRKIDIDFYKQAEKSLIVATIINSMVIFGLLFLGISLGLIKPLGFLIYDPLLLIYGSFVLGFGYAVFCWSIMIRKYEAVHGL